MNSVWARSQILFPESEILAATPFLPQTDPATPDRPRYPTDPATPIGASAAIAEMTAVSATQKMASVAIEILKLTPFVH